MISVDSTVLGDWLLNGGEFRESALRLQKIDGDWNCVSAGTMGAGE